MEQNGSFAIDPLESNDKLKCPLCVEYFKEPRTLRCLHTFCERCLELYITDKKAGAKDGVINSLMCPVCDLPALTEHLQRSAQDIVSEIPLNKLMDQTNDDFPTPGVNNWRKDKKKFVHFSQLCGMCLKDNLKVKATTYCHGCGDFRCRRCTNKHSVVGDRMREVDHDVVDIEEMSAVTASKLSDAINKYTLCKEHPEQELKFYCTDHEMLLCRDCDVTSHMKCRLAEDFEGLSKSISQLRETWKMKEEMKGLQDDLGFIVDTLRDNNAEITKQSQSVSSKVHSMKETIIQLFEELEESASETIKRSREHVAKQNSGKAFKMKQLISAIEGSCSLLDSVAEHGTHRQLFTVFQKLKLQLQNYVSLVKQEKDGLVRTSIIMDIDHDLESLISGFDKVGEVRLESSKIEVPKRQIKLENVPNSRKGTEVIGQDKREKSQSLSRNAGDDNENGRPSQLGAGKVSTSPGLDYKDQALTSNMHDMMSEKETQTDLSEKETQTELYRSDGMSASSHKDKTQTSPTKGITTQRKLPSNENSRGSKEPSETPVLQNRNQENHAIKTPQINVSGGTTPNVNINTSQGRHSQGTFSQNSNVAKSKAHTLNVPVKKHVLGKKTMSNELQNGTLDSSQVLMSETISQMESEITIMLDISSKLIQSKELKQDNPYKTRQCIAVCTLKEAIVLVFKTIKRTGISFNIVALDLETLTEFKTMEIKKEPKEIIAYDGKHFVITFPDLGFIDFFSYKPGSPKRKKRAAVPADITLEKSVKSDIRSAVLCKYRKEEFALSTSNYFGTITHEGTLTKLFYYSMSLRSVETDFWRTQLAVVKLAYDQKNEIIYAATAKPFKLFSFTVFGEVIAETVLDATVTSLELDRRGKIYVCYNNAVDRVGRICQVVPKVDGQRAVTIDNSNPGFVRFSRKTKRFHVVENQSNLTRIEEYELELLNDEEEEIEEQEDSDSLTTDNA